jgi:hypothetical protein
MGGRCVLVAIIALGDVAVASAGFVVLVDAITTSTLWMLFGLTIPKVTACNFTIRLSLPCVARAVGRRMLVCGCSGTQNVNLRVNGDPWEAVEQCI